MHTLRRYSILVAIAFALLNSAAHAADQAAATSAMPKFSGLLQAWYLSGDDPTVDTFRLRRSELKAVGQVGTKVRWTVMIDPSKSLSINKTTTTIDGQQVVTDTSVNQASRILQDAFISVMPTAKVQVDMGQLKVPMGAEGLQSSAALETIERALFASDRGRGGTFGDIRDIGAVVRYMPAPSVDVIAGAFNGSGESQNDVDRNDQKSWAGRLVWRPPFAKGLQLGAWAVRAGDTVPGRPRRDRGGAELLFVRDKLTLRGEYVSGKDDAIERRGYYGLVAYKLRPNLEAAARVDTWDPDTDRNSNAASVSERDYVAGFNYYLDGLKAKLQLNYLSKTFSDPVVQDRHQIIVNVQTSW
jgi:hypothetical protein